MKNLTTAIFGKMTSSTDLYTDIGGRLYKGAAEEGAEYPYIVFMVVSDAPEKTFSEDFEKVLIQFSLFSAEHGTTEVENMFTHLKALYDECDFSITGSTLVWMKRQNANLIPEYIDVVPAGTQRIWHYVVDYEIITSLS